MAEFYKTIIIGAGPAGLTAGRYLDKALILDKKKEIGRPVQCGEGISKKALEFQNIKPDSSWISCEIYKMEGIMPNGKEIGKQHKEAIGYVIDREKFEKFLAKNTKAKIELNAEVTDLKLKDNLWEVSTKNGKTFKSRYIIGADGPLSIVRRKVFPENQKNAEFISTIEYLVEIEKEFDIKTLKIYLNNKKYNHGYAWIFPKSKNTANIGIGGRGNLSKAFDEFLKNTIMKNYGNYRFLENRSGVIPFFNTQLKIYKSNALLTGDAAKLADPIFKGGINQAMCSSKIAAQCILGSKVELYEKRIKLMPFADYRLIKASRIFYSLSNETLNELGSLFEKEGFSYVKTIACAAGILSKPLLLKNAYKLFIFLSALKKNENYI